MKFTLRIAAFIAVIMLLFSTVWAQDGAQKMPIPRVYALIFKADWCSNCRVLGPKAMKVIPEYVPKGVIPVELDMTNDETTKKSLMVAKKMGLTKIVEGNDGTGFAVLVDPKTKNKLGKVTSNMTEDEMKAALDKALAKTSVKSSSK
jgi:hypothetical protein